MVPSARRSIDTVGSLNEIARSGDALPPGAGRSPLVGTGMSGLALMSGGLYLGGLAVEEGANPKLCLFVALRNGRHQGLHQETGLRIGFGNHGPHPETC